MWRKLYLFFGSLHLAVFTLLLLSAILAVGTVVESMYGMRAAKVSIYSSLWFFGVLFLLFINVLFAALIRFPWKPSQYGFAITHLGILTILVGSVMTLRWGVDGLMGVPEEGQNHIVQLGDAKLYVKHVESGNTAVYPIPESPRKSQGRLLEIALTPHTNLLLDEFLPRVRVRENRTQSRKEGLGTPQVRVEISNSRMQVGKWLEVSHPTQPTLAQIGPATLSLKKLWTEEEEKAFLATDSFKSLEPSKSLRPSLGTLVIKKDGREVRWPISMENKKWQKIPTYGVELRFLRHLSHAVVRDNQLVNRTTEAINPALQVEVRGKSGQIEKHTIFAHFPWFETLHARGAPKEKSGVKFQFVVAEEKPEPQTMGQLYLAQSVDNQKMFYKIFGKKGDLKKKGELTLGEKIPTGWMDLQLVMTDWLKSGITRLEPQYVDNIAGMKNNFFSAIHLSTESRDPQKRQVATTPFQTWLYDADGFIKSVNIDGQQFELSFGKSQIRLPFALQLEKFHLGTNPGTEKAASYKSDVRVVPLGGGTPGPTREISMNEPLVSEQFTFYQSSYSMNPVQKTYSYFSVNRDPGRMVKYIGSLVMVFGILIMFYMNPHYMGLMVGRKKSTQKENA